MLFGKWSRHLGGLLLFIGLLFFILLFAGFYSGFFSHSFAQSAVTKIINYTVSQDNLNSVVYSVNITGLENTVTPELNSQISYVNCGMGCLASSYIKSISGISIGMNNIDLFHYELVSLALAIIGAVLIFFSYEKEKKLSVIGKNIISMSIISLTIFYIPIAYLIPILVSFPVSSYSIRVPAAVFSGFAATLFLIYIAVIIIGVVLLTIAAIIDRKRKNPVQSTGTKLIVAHK